LIRETFSGARVAVDIAKVYPSFVQKLILLSPVGIDGPWPSRLGTEGVTQSDPTSSKRRPKKFGEAFFQYMWAKHHITPLAMIRLSGPLLPWVIGAFVYSSSLYDWIGEDRELRLRVARYTYALVRDRSSADVLMPCFISMYHPRLTIFWL